LYHDLQIHGKQYEDLLLIKNYDSVHIDYDFVYYLET